MLMYDFLGILIFITFLFSTTCWSSIRASSICPSNWVADTTNYPGICYLFNNTLFPISWDDAYNNCNASSSNLPIFHTMSELLSFVNVLGTYAPGKCTSNDYLLLGIKGNITTSAFTWIDDYNVTFPEKWANNEPNILYGLGTVAIGFIQTMMTVNSTADDTPSAAALQPTDTSSSRCPSINWYYDNVSDSCFIYTWYFYNWNDATHHCEFVNPNATLPSFCSTAELISFIDLLKNTNSYCDRGWTGLSDIFQHGTILDANGFPPNFIPWSAPFEHSCNGSSICLDYAPWTEQNTTFQPQSCTSTRPFFCQIRLSGTNCSSINAPPNNVFCNFTITADPSTSDSYVATTTTTDITSTSTISALLTSCPVDWTLDPVHMICYYLHLFWDTMSLAQTQCQNLLPYSTLPIFRNVDEYDSYINMISLAFFGSCKTEFWLGITSNASGSYWLDNSPVTFSFSSNGIIDGRCAIHYFNGNGWDLQAYCNYSSYYVCQYRLNVPSVVTGQPVTTNTTSQSNCPIGWTDDSTGICYNQTNLSLPWEDAQNYCISLAPNASLPVFCNSSEVDSFNLYRSKVRNVMCYDIAWVGFRDINGTSEFYWVNHVNFSVTLNWYYGPICTQTPSCGYALGLVYGTSVLSNTPLCDVSARFYCQYRPRGNCDYTTGVPQYCQTQDTTTVATSTATEFDTTTSSTLASTTASTTSSEWSTIDTDSSTTSEKVVSTTAQMTVSSTLEETSSTTATDNPTSSAEQSSTPTEIVSASIADILPTDAMSTIYETVNETTQNPFASALFTELEIKSEVTSNSAALAPTIQDASTFLVQYLNDSMRNILGYELKDMIRSCTFKEIPCNFDEDFEEFYNPALGNCYTFNGGNHPKYWSNQAGSTYGLELTLSASQAEYTCSSSVAGFRINIHENNIRPFPDAEGFNIPLSSLTGINLQRTSLVKLGPPYSKCVTSTFKQFVLNYSVEACQRSCFQDFLQSSCNCADPRYPNSKGVQTCDFKQKQCLDYARDCMADFIECDCPSACNQTLYKGTLTSSRLNIESLLETWSCLNDSDIYCNVTSKTDFSILSVYYQQMTSIVQVENTAYGMYQLYADICSVTGLVLGVGVITVLEMFVIVCMCISRMMKEML